MAGVAIDMAIHITIITRRAIIITDTITVAGKRFAVENHKPERKFRLISFNAAADRSSVLSAIASQRRRKPRAKDGGNEAVLRKVLDDGEWFSLVTSAATND